MDRWGSWQPRGTLCMGVCLTHNSGNYLSRGVHRGLGSIGYDGGRGGGGASRQSNSDMIIVLCVSKSRGQLSVSCY